MINLNSLQTEFSGIDFREKRSGLYKVLIPFFYEDGDMYDIFVEESPVSSAMVRISDYGLTLMKLSYNFEFDTPHKQDVLEEIVSQNRCKMFDGSIYLDTPFQHFSNGLFQFIQTITKVSNMDIINQEMMKSYFYDFLKQFVDTSLSKYTINTGIHPIKENKDLLVDFEIQAPRPIYMFGVKGDTKASKAVIACLTFNAKKIAYRSLIIPENIDNLSIFNRNQLMNNCDKVYTNFEQFKEKGSEYIERELIAG